MQTSMFLLLGAATIFLVSIILYYWIRSHHAQNSLPVPVLENLDGGQPCPGIRIQSPILSCSFDEALSYKGFVAELQRCSLANLNQTLSYAAGDNENIVLQSLRMSKSGKEFLFTYSEKGEKLVKEGKATLSIHSATGRNLPMLRSTESGKTVEILKGVSKNTAKLATVSALVVSAAHVVSGADLAKKLESVSQDVKFLVAARRIDQLSELRGTYSHVRGILLGSLNENSIGELRRECKALTILRSKWRGEIEHELNEIRDPSNRPWLRRKLSRDRIQDRKIVKQMSPLQSQIALIDFTLLLQLAISEAMGATPHFIFDVLPEELGGLKHTAENLKTKVAYITGRYQGEVERTKKLLEGFELVQDRYSAFVSESTQLMTSLEGSNSGGDDKQTTA